MKKEKVSNNSELIRSDFKDPLSFKSLGGFTLKIGSSIVIACALGLFIDNMLSILPSKQDRLNKSISKVDSCKILKNNP